MRDYASQLWFTAPFCVAVRKTAVPEPASGQVLVRSRYSAVSAGTELLLYRGQIPTSMPLDASLATLQNSSQYPLQYGYACVGEVQQLGSDVDPTWQGRQVFSFQPHASHFLASPNQLLPIPDDVSAKDAVCLPSMETAINLIQDGQPVLGERVAVLGQGVVGLLLSALLSRFPLASLIAIEGQSYRQELARQMGVDSVRNPADMSEADQAKIDADLIYEVSGQPEALKLAIALSGFASRIVIGSWYGDQPVSIDLGGPAHRNRLQLITSQVSSLAPALSGRWDKQRRFDLAWDMIRCIRPAQLVTHTRSLDEAGALYAQLHEENSGFMQILFHYPD